MNTYLIMIIVAMIPMFIFLALVARYYYNEKKHPNYSPECIYNNHSSCTAHLHCMCPHHDRIIHEEMAK